MDQFPKEILLHIFGHFQNDEIESVENVVLKMVCKDFYNIIVQIPSNVVYHYICERTPYVLMYYCDNMLYARMTKMTKYEPHFNTLVSIHKSKISNRQKRILTSYVCYSNEDSYIVFKSAILFNTPRKQLIPYIYSVPDFSIKRYEYHFHGTHYIYLDCIKYQVEKYITGCHNPHYASEFMFRYIWFKPYKILLKNALLTNAINFNFLNIVSNSYGLRYSIQNTIKKCVID
jgi:hypothetical protein